MEYRHYLVKAKKTDLDEIKTISLEDVKKHIKTYFDLLDYECKYILLEDIIKYESVFEFGNMFYDNSGLIEYMLELSKPALENKKVEKLLPGCDYCVIDDKVFTKIAQYCAQHKPDILPELVQSINGLNWEEYNLIFFGECLDLV